MSLHLDGDLPKIEEKKGLVEKFVSHCCKMLGIDNDYDVHIVDDRDAHEIRTTAYYDPNNEIIKVYGKDRALPDVLRSIAHELVHAKQHVKGEFEEHPRQDIGGYLEDDANARAGSLLKGFGLSREDDDVYEVRRQFENLVVESVMLQVSTGQKSLSEIKESTREIVREALTAGAVSAIESLKLANFGKVSQADIASGNAVHIPVIQALQQGLKDMGFDPGKIDGIFDAATEKAVRSFQGKNNIKQTGTTTKETWEALLKANEDGKIKSNVGVQRLRKPEKKTAVAAGKVNSDSAKRAQELSKDTGIPAEVIYAIEMRESFGDPNAFAYNAHISRNPKYSAISGHTLSSSAIRKLPSGRSYYGSNAKKQFNRAYKVDPVAAIAGGAWGLYQVLGAFSLLDHDGDPEKFLAAWNSNPEEHSKTAFKRWVDRNPKAVEAMKSGDTPAWVRRYYGAASSDYINHVTKNMARYNRAYRATS
jgi:peptidoglycan hydrolase-like protein with peptidoglycan-binding domain